MNKHWYLVGQSAGARIFEQCGIKPELQLIRRFDNPQGMLKTSELVSDQQGRSDSSAMHGGHNALGTDNNQKRHVLEKFAAELGDFLESEAERNSYNSLVLVAEPHFLSALRKAIKKGTSHLLLESVNKDLVHTSDHEMAAQLSENLCIRESI